MTGTIDPASDGLHMDLTDAQSATLAAHEDTDERVVGVVDDTPILRRPDGKLFRLGADGQIRSASPRIYDILGRRALLK